MTEIQWRLLVCLVAVIAWLVAAALDGFRAPVRSWVMMVVSILILGAAVIAATGPIRVLPGFDATVGQMAVWLAAFVGAIGVAYDIEAGTRRWRTYRAVPRDRDGS